MPVEESPPEDAPVPLIAWRLERAAPTPVNCVGPAPFPVKAVEREGA